MSNTALKRCIN